MKAILVFDPDRRPEQLQYVTDRTAILRNAGDQVWVDISETQAQRFSAQGVSVLFQEGVDWIELPSVSFDPAERVPAPPPSLQAVPPVAGDRAYTLVQFMVPPDAAWLEAVVKLGAFYIQNLPISVSVFRMTSDQITAAAALPFVRWVGLYHPAYALHYALAGRGEPFSAVSLAGMSLAAGSLPDGGSHGNVQVVLFDDVDPVTIQPAVEATGVTVINPTGYGFIVNADAAGVEALLRLPGVMDVEIFMPPEPENDRGRIILNINQVSHPGSSGFLVNLDGSGEIVGVMDTGLDHGDITNLATIHPDIRGTAAQRKVLGIFNVSGGPLGNPVPDTSPHGTHVTGTIAGDGTASGGRAKGMAPAASVIFQGPIQSGTAAVIPFLRAHYNGARVHSNSWGSTIGALPSNNLYNLAITSQIDRFCYLYPESLVVFSAGNDETDATGGADGVLDMNTLKIEKGGKNVLVVGAVESERKDDGYKDTYRSYFGTRYNHADFDALAGGASDGYTMSDSADQMALFSSRGIVNHNPPGPVAIAPTGRVKPDVVAPGTNILSLRSSQVPLTGDWQEPSTVDKNLYQILHGTSMAAPHVSGTALLVRQFFRTRFGLLRHPILLESVSPRVSPPPDFVDLPATAPHVDGALFAWVSPAAPPDTKRIVASVFSPNTTQLNAALIQLQGDVGDHPAPVLARSGDHALLLHRHRDGSLLLSKYRKNAAPPYNLSLDTGFNTTGSVSVSSNVHAAEDRLPAMVVANNEIGVVWCESGAGDLNFRAFDVANGNALGAGSQVLGTISRTSTHAYLVHTGNRFAAAWVNQSGSNHSVLFRIPGEGTGPVTVKTGSTEIRASHLAWDGRNNRFVVAWCEVGGAQGDSIKLQFLADDGALQDGEITATTAPAGRRIRRPFIAVHPSAGYLLAWEDDAQGGQYDVYFSFLDDSGLPDAGHISEDPRDPTARRIVRVSDTPQDTQGFSVSMVEDGAFIVWQSLDEVNSDNLNVSMVKITLQGVFYAQADPLTPLEHNGRYVPHALSEGNPITSLDTVSMAWTGGDYYLLRWEGGQELEPSRLTLVRTNADGKKDDTFGVNGGLTLSSDLFTRRCEMHWTGRVLACMLSGGLSSPSVHLFDDAGHPLDGSKPGTVAFGAAGVRRIEVLGVNDISPQLSHMDLPAPDFGTVAVYGEGFPFSNAIKYTILNRSGAFVDSTGAAVAGPVDLVTHTDPMGMIGTAKHGWFHFVSQEGHSIAVWHQKTGPAGNSDVMINRFNPNGVAVGVPPDPSQAPAMLLPRPAGNHSDSVNAVVAPRPVGIGGPADPSGIPSNSTQREYVAVWQYRADNAQPWEIRFSRLERDGRVKANPAAPAPPASDVRVIFPGLTDAGGNVIWPPVAGTAMHATHPQIVCTFTDAPWKTTAPAGAFANAWRQWSPGFGLAWLGQPVAGGNRTLYFTVLDENGNRVLLDRTPPAAAPMAGIIPLSRPEVDVADFKLIWNGRLFRLTWTEIENGRIRHMQTAVTRQGSLRVHDHPSAALLKAALINGATNIRDTTLPNIPVAPITDANRNDGYGWGRVNLRQSLLPSRPVTFHVRDGDAVGQGRTAGYRFSLPPGTDLLRVTLAWTDPPGPLVINNLNLRVTAAATGRVYIGNSWDTSPGNGWRSRVFAAGDAFDTANTIEQVVISFPPSGEYLVEVIGHTVSVNPDYQFPAQPFALVFVGSGPEVRYRQRNPCEEDYF